MFADLIGQRLHNQRLNGQSFQTPDEVVRWFGAVQAQDYLGSLWAIGMRTQNATEVDVEQAIAERKIIRTWPMRSTLHFVPPEDVRWMLKLLTPRVIARSLARYRQLELDDAVFTRSRKLFERALRDGKQLSRGMMYEVLNEAGISTRQTRGLHVLGRLAQDGVICFGPRQGKQPSFVLLDEWVPTGKQMDREAALAELARRYFTSHGPATVHDFAWWSGLTLVDVRAGIALAKPNLTEDRINGQVYWRASSVPIKARSRSTAHLLPAFDEYTVAYKDRSMLVDPASLKLSDPVRSILGPAILMNGKLVGNWKRTFDKKSVTLSPVLFARVNPSEQRAFSNAAQEYGRFLGLPVVMK
jgi:hypothetical protein